LVTSSTADSGAEFPDPSVSVAYDYIQALTAHGALVVCLPVVTDLDWISGVVARVDGVLLTGGGDIEPTLYGPDVSPEMRALCEFSKPGRDTMEVQLIREVFRQKKPCLAICRGHQLVNVVLGGTLFVDLPSQRPSPIQHCDYDRRFEAIHPIQTVIGTHLSELLGSGEIGVNSTHHQAIDRLAPGLVVAARAPDGLIEATEFSRGEPGRNAWYQSVQFHPERLRSQMPVHDRLFAEFVGASRDQVHV